MAALDEDCVGDYMLKCKSMLVTGGTGTFGRAFVRRILASHLKSNALSYLVEMNLSNLRWHKNFSNFLKD